MAQTDWVSAAVIVLVVLAASLARWWSGRTLVAFADDPALPERLVSSRRHSVIVFSVALGAIVAVAPHWAVWSVPLLVVCRMIAGFSARKTLYGKTWSVWVYLWFFARLVATVFGFWILLALLPVIAAAAGSRAWMVALPLAAVLLAWNRDASRITRYVLGSGPVADAALTSRFAALAAKCAMPAPRFESVDLHGGAVANAIALASLRGSSVLFSDTLLSRLDRDEAAAICAHELAHLEHFAPRLRRLNLVNQVLIVLAAAAAIAAPIVSPLVEIAWMGVLAIALLWRARNRQRNETASDRRAVELTGDGEALVRALTKLYVVARIPRRLDPELERQATHPSLARRIRDIRKAAGAPPVILETGASFTSADGRILATFGRDHLEWREGDAATHSLNYGYLSELRVRAPRSGPAHLVAVEAGGRKWELALAQADLARAQQVLDAVDGRLPDLPRARGRSVASTRAVAAVTALIALPLAQMSLFYVAVLAAAQPGSSLVGGAALAALATAAVMLRQTGIAAMSYPSWVAVIPAAMGVLLLVFARRLQKDDMARPRPLLAAIMAVLLAFALLPLALGGLDAIRLHDSARSSTAAVVLLMALGGTLAFRQDRRHGYLALAPVVLAGAIALMGTTTFLERFASDPFLVRAEPIPMTVVGHSAAGEFSIPFFVTELRLSPSGRHVIIVPATEADDDEATTFRVGRAGGTLTPVTAHDVIFTDDDHVLVAQGEGHGITLRQANADPLSDVWQQHVPDLRDAALSYSPRTNRWRLLGRDDDRRIVRAEGVVGVAGVEKTSWAAPEGGDDAIDAIAATGDRALVSEAHFKAGWLQRSRLLWRWAWMLQPPQRELRFWSIGTAGRNDVAVSRLGTRCVDRVLGDDRLVCSVFDGSDTRFVAIDPATGQATALGALRGRMVVYHAASPGWLSGWADSTPVALRLSTREAFRAAADPLHRVTQITAAEHVAGTVSFDGTRSIVRLYAID